ncbi:hypothetical protein ACLQ29_18555 [Micromonospora sp. DT228]|uniref:hypothetical protein n=1 Tax=Micromonospora sp. DT228 TaxID=3393443 RepID=UPI003CF43A09
MDEIAADAFSTQVRPKGEQNATLGMIEDIHPRQQFLACRIPHGHLRTVVRVRYQEIRVVGILRPGRCAATQDRDERGEVRSERPVVLEPVGHVHRHTVAEQVARFSSAASVARSAYGFW